MCILANCRNLSVKGKLGVQYDTKSCYLICGGEGGRSNRETVTVGKDCRHCEVPMSVASDFVGLRYILL